MKTKRAWSEDTIREAKLGLAQGLDLAGHLASKGFDLELAKKAGVVKRDGSAFFEGRIVIPYFGRGRVVYMSARALDGSKPPKYLNLPVNRPAERVAYSADALHRQEKLIIVEGFADALTLKQWGYDVVSLAGTALSEQELQLIRGHDRIYLSFDQGPFDRAMLMGKRIARQTGVVPYLVELPQGVKDPNEFASQGHSRSEYGSLLEQSRELLDIMLEHTLSCTGLERADLERELLACTRRLSESDIERYRERAVPALGIKPERLTAYLEAARRGETVPLGVFCRGYARWPVSGDTSCPGLRGEDRGGNRSFRCSNRRQGCEQALSDHEQQGEA